MQSGVDGPVLPADDVGRGGVLPAVVVRNSSAAAGGLGAEQADRPGGEGFRAAVVEDVGRPVGTQTGRPVGLGPDRAPEFRGRPAQGGRALPGVQDEGRQIDQMARPAHSGDHGSAVGVPEHQRGFLQRVDDGLDRFGVRRQRASVEFGGDGVDPRGPQASRHRVEVLGAVVEAVDEHDGRQLLRLLGVGFRLVIIGVGRHKARDRLPRRTAEVSSGVPARWSPPQPESGGPRH